MIGDSHVDHIMLSLVSVWPWFTNPLRKLAEMCNGVGLLKFMKFLERRIAYMRQELADDKAPARSNDGPVSMMQAMLDAQADEKKGITNWDILAAMASNIAAGSDTTALGIISTVFYLYSNPACLVRLRHEIDAADLPDKSRFHDVQKLPYLQAALKEGLRLAPGFGLPLWREVPKGGAVIAGQFFPAGVSLYIFDPISFFQQALRVLHNILISDTEHVGKRRCQLLGALPQPGRLRSRRGLVPSGAVAGGLGEGSQRHGARLVPLWRWLARVRGQEPGHAGDVESRAHHRQELRPGRLGQAGETLAWRVARSQQLVHVGSRLPRSRAEQEGHQVEFCPGSGRASVYNSLENNLQR